jgi:hypothetical protein
MERVDGERCRQPVLLRATRRCRACWTALARSAHRLLAHAGPRGGARRCAPVLARAARRSCARALPALTQRDFDHLLWSCDLNFVRGEDSLVRAHLGRRPSSGRSTRRTMARTPQARAFLDRFCRPPNRSLRLPRCGAPGTACVPALRADPLPFATAWARTAAWRDRLAAQRDLTPAARIRRRNAKIKGFAPGLPQRAIFRRVPRNALRQYRHWNT